MKKYNDLIESKRLEEMLLSLPIEKIDREIVASYVEMIFQLGCLEGLNALSKVKEV